MHKKTEIRMMIVAAVFLLAGCRLPGGEAMAAGGKPNVKVFNNGKLKLTWNLEGDKLNVRLASSYKGFMAFGMNPKPSMTGADLIIATMDAAGNFSVEDHFCKQGKKHKADRELGGSSRVLSYSGSSNNGWNVVEFTLSAQSDDPNDISLISGNKYYFLVAASDNPSFKIVHPFYDKFLVTL